MCERDSRTGASKAMGSYLELSALRLLFQSNENQVTRIDSCISLLLRRNEVEDGHSRNYGLSMGPKQLNVNFERLDSNRGVRNERTSTPLKLSYLTDDFDQGTGRFNVHSSLGG